MTSPILALPHGVTVVIAEHRPDGFHRAIVVHSTNPSYRVGGYDLSVSDATIAEARVVTLPDDLMADLIAGSPVLGPVPTLEELAARWATGR